MLPWDTGTSRTVPSSHHLSSLPNLQLKAQASRLKPFPPGWAKPGSLLASWLPSFLSHSHLKCQLYSSPATQASVPPDDEPEGNQSHQEVSALLPEFFHNVDHREDQLSHNTGTTSSLPHLFLKHHTLAGMLCTQNTVLLFYLHVCSGFTISNKPVISPGQDFVSSSGSHSQLLQAQGNCSALCSC